MISWNKSEIEEDNYNLEPVDESGVESLNVFNYYDVFDILLIGDDKDF